MTMGSAAYNKGIRKQPSSSISARAAASSKHYKKQVMAAFCS